VSISILNLCWGTFIVIFLVILGISWFINHLPFIRSEVNEAGIHRIYYREGKAVFYKVFDQALIELESGNRPVAKELFEKFIKLEPGNALGYSGLGQYYLSEDILEAQQCFQKAHNLDRKLVLPLLHLGNIEFQHANFNKAIEYLEKAVILKRNLPEIHLELGKSYDKINQTAKALKHYKRFLQLAGNSFDLTEVRQRVDILSYNKTSDT